MTLVYLSGNRIEGLSSDTKPTTAQDKAVFFETDTVKTFDYLLSSTTWTERTASVTIGAVVTAHDTTIGNYTTPNSAVSSSNREYAWSGTESITAGTGYLGNGSNGSQASWGSPINQGSIPDSPDITTFRFTIAVNGSPWYNWSNTKIKLYNSSNTLLSTYETGMLNIQTQPLAYTFTPSVSSVSYWTTESLNQASGSNISAVSYTGSRTKSRDPAVTFDGDTSTYWQSNDENNPNLYVDMGSSTTTTGIILNSQSATDETEITIQTSDNASAWTTQRTILVSSLTHGSNNFIRFPPVSCRYVRVYGTSSNKTLGIAEFKCKSGVTDSNIVTGHSHLDISASDTSIGLDGT